jgi:hypothetical protein
MNALAPLQLNCALITRRARGDRGEVIEAVVTGVRMMR